MNEMEELLIKYIEGNCSSQEKAKVVEWLDSDPANMKEYLALRKMHDITIWQTKAPANQRQPVQKTNRRWLKPVYSEIFKVAAIFAVALLVLRYLPPVKKQESAVTLQTLHVPVGQRAEITLQDGTKVWLNSKTTLTFPNHFSGQTREVKLDGEAFFEVAHNPSNPFIVNAGKYNIKVWGTKFNLMAYSDVENFETSLLEGSVEILKQGVAKGVKIQPNEKISLENDHLIIAPIDNMDHFLWKDGILSFDDDTFPEIVKKLELYFDLKIVVKNDHILNYRCTGKFRMKDGVEHILKVLQLSNKFDYKIDDKTNVITIK